MKKGQKCVDLQCSHAQKAAAQWISLLSPFYAWNLAELSWKTQVAALVTSTFCISSVWFQLNKELSFPFPTLINQ